MDFCFNIYIEDFLTKGFSISNICDLTLSSQGDKSVDAELNAFSQ